MSAAPATHDDLVEMQIPHQVGFIEFARRFV
jgi:hypothetical protein